MQGTLKGEAESASGKPHELGCVLAKSIDNNAIVVTENLTGKYESFRFGFREDEQMLVGTSGAALDR